MSAEWGLSQQRSCTLLNAVRSDLRWRSTEAGQAWPVLEGWPCASECPSLEYIQSIRMVGKIQRARNQRCAAPPLFNPHSQCNHLRL
jgi:hypothetical protein